MKLKEKTQIMASVVMHQCSLFSTRNINSFKFKSDKEILAMQAKHGTKKVLEDILEMFKDCFGTSISDESFYDNFVKNYKTDKQKDYLVSKYQRHCRRALL